MKNLITWIKNNPIRSMFLVPIFLVAGISISHVVAWYDISNPLMWAIYLSISVEIGAIAALIAASQRIKGGVWIMFGLVTFVQLIGNVFYSYKEIDINGDLFKAWIELTTPIFEMIGTDTNDLISMKRWLAILEGGLLPLISLTSLHFFVKYDDTNDNSDKQNENSNLVIDTTTTTTIPPTTTTTTIPTTTTTTTRKKRVVKKKQSEIVEPKKEEIEPIIIPTTTTTTTVIKRKIPKLTYSKPNVSWSR